MPTAGDFNHTVSLKIAVNAVFANYFFNLDDVVTTKLFKNRNFIRKPFLSVGDAMRQRIVHESTVATARTRADFVRLNEHYITIRITLFGNDCCPQAGETATDHAQIAVFIVNCSWVRVGLVDII